MQAELANRRILVIDDNQAIHDDFRKALRDDRGPDSLIDLESALFGDAAPARGEGFDITSAYQGAEGLARVTEALAASTPFAVAFVDIRMPPGWDGVETIERLWKVDPDLQVVICSAYSDYNGDGIRHRLGDTDGLLILRKPFDTTEVSQLAHALTRKWALARAHREREQQLDALVRSRTDALEQEVVRRQRVEAELALARKLEAVGSLAAGIAHEINNPSQFISDNVSFLRASFEDLEILRTKVRAAIAARDAARSLLDEVDALEDELDIEYIKHNVPRALDMADEGVRRISAIVQAMRTFGHNDGGVKAPVDLNEVLRTTLDVSCNEYRYVADVETDFGELPDVTCSRSEIGQVFLNLVVNAAHAIEPIAKRSGAKGRIRVHTRLDRGEVVVTVEDNGCGIPDAIRPRIFDPFFTTKDVGGGKGQGLSIARTIVDRHGGRLDVDSTVGKGTTFTLRLPAPALVEVAAPTTECAA